MQTCDLLRIRTIIGASRIFQLYHVSIFGGGTIKKNQIRKCELNKKADIWDVASCACLIVTVYHVTTRFRCVHVSIITSIRLSTRVHSRFFVLFVLLDL